MKDFKFLSALALTGMLTAGIMGTTSAATPVGLFAKGELVEDAAVVPFVLESKEDKVTVESLKETYNATNITGDKNGVVGTGTTFKVNGETYTALVYGDVNGNGEITTADATQVQLNIAGQKDLTKTQQEAGNVIRKEGSGLTTTDATNIQLYVAQGKAIPDAKPEKEKIETSCTVTMADPYINTENVSSAKATITMNPVLTEERTASLYLVGADGSNKQEVQSGIPIKANTTKDELTFTGLSDLPEGTSTLRLISTPDGEILAEFTVEKHTTEVEKAKIAAITTIRLGENTGSVSFQVIPGESKIVKAYYVAKPRSADETATEASATIRNEFGKPIDPETPSIAIQNNKVENAEIPGLEKEKVYDVFFVLEDEYGSVSSHLCNSADDTASVVSAVIPSDKATKNAPTVSNVKMPDFATETSTTTAKITWDATAVDPEEDNTSTTIYLVTLYKDGKAIATAKTRAGTKELTLDKFGVETPLEVGAKYTAGVIAKGDHETFDAPEVKATNEQTVEDLTAVTNVKFNQVEDETNTAKVDLSWESDYNELSSEVEGFSVEVASYDTTEGEYKEESYTDVAGGTTLDKTWPDVLNGKDTSTLYKARVTVERPEKTLGKINSKPTVSEKAFFIVPTVTVGEKIDSEVTLSIPQDEIKVSGKDAEYSVELYTVTGNGLSTAQYSKVGTQNVEINAEDGTFKVTGLTDKSANYAIKLVATVDGITSKSPYIAITGTLFDQLDITNKKVVTLEEGTRTGKDEIAKTDSGISVDGKEYTSDVTDIKNLVEKLNVGDLLTYTNTKIEITLNGANAERDFGNVLKDKKVSIVGTEKGKTLKSTSSSGELAEVTLTGGEGTFTIDGLNAGKIVVNNGTKIASSAAKDVVVPNGQITYNTTLTASVDAETELTLTSKDSVSVKAGSDSAVKLNSESTSLLTVTLAKGTDSEGEDITEIAGSLDITANGATVTASEDMTEVTTDITVKSTDGNVDLKDAKLKGSQSVTIKNSATADKKVTALIDEIPFVIPTAIEVKEYTKTDLRDLSSVTPAVTEENLDEFNDFIKSFGVNITDPITKTVSGIGKAKIKTTKATSSTANQVEISFSEATVPAGKTAADYVTITGLKK